MPTVSQPSFKDITGQKFGRLTAVSYAGALGKRRSFWDCVCECGKPARVESGKLRSGHSKSCGCLKHDVGVANGRATRKLVHKPKHPLGLVHNQMLQRCCNLNNPAYPNYGGRGISVCDRWRFGDGKQSAMRCFAADMGERPSRLHSLDRINNDGNYEPANCRWATRKQQAQNRRSNLLVTVNGTRIALSAACDLLGLDFTLVYGRMQHGRTFGQASRGAETC
jgi:hypothetical protein